ncbi:MAG: hypothetical protein ACFB9N_08455 [Geitlerinemataceae cyanobacterium]
MKYFFLSEGWNVARVWGPQGLWNVAAWRRPPEIERMELCIVEKGERLWLHRAEDSVLMLEVKADADDETAPGIGQVVLKRLMDADAVLLRLSTPAAVCEIGYFDTIDVED